MPGIGPGDLGGDGSEIFASVTSIDESYYIYLPGNSQPSRQSGTSLEDQAKKLLAEGLEEVKKRIRERPACAALFGGIKQALRELDKVKFSFGFLEGGAFAEIAGKGVTIDPRKFIESGGTFPISQNIREVQEGAVKRTRWTSMSVTLSGATFAAFGIFHEFGHLRKVYDKRFNVDGVQQGNLHGYFLEQGANNEKIRAACFSELQPVLVFQ